MQSLPFAGLPMWVRTKSTGHFTINYGPKARDGFVGYPVSCPPRFTLIVFPGCFTPRLLTRRIEPTNESGTTWSFEGL